MHASLAIGGEIAFIHGSISKEAFSIGNEPCRTVRRECGIYNGPMKLLSYSVRITLSWDDSSVQVSRAAAFVYKAF